MLSSDKPSFDSPKHSQFTDQEHREIQEIKQEIEKMLNDEGSNMSFLSDLSDDDNEAMNAQSIEKLPIPPSNFNAKIGLNTKFFSEFNQPQIQKLKNEIQTKNGEIIILRQKLLENSRLKNEIYQKNQEIIKLKSKSKFVPLKALISKSSKKSQEYSKPKHAMKDSCIQAETADSKLINIIKDTGLVALESQEPIQVLKSLNPKDPKFLLNLEATIKAQLLSGSIGQEFHLIKNNHRINRLLCDHLPMEFMMEMPYADDSDYLSTMYRILHANSKVRIDELLALLGGKNDYLLLRILGKLYFLKILPPIHQLIIDHLYQLDMDDNVLTAGGEDKSQIFREGFGLLAKCLGEVGLESYTKLYCMIKKRNKKFTMGLHQLFD